MTFVLGDSNVRQFYLPISSHSYGTIFFSGATIKGLVNENSCHHAGSLVRSISRDPYVKHVVLMFGSVDYDFSINKHLWDCYCSKNIHPDEEHVYTFISEVILRYIQFIKDLLIQTSATVHILAPQISPLNLKTFVNVLRSQNSIPTPEQDSDMYKLQNTLLNAEFFSNSARAARTILANDRLGVAINELHNSQIMYHRIDKDMVNNDTGEIQSKFITGNNDHHPKLSETLLLWKSKLGDLIKEFK